MVVPLSAEGVGAAVAADASVAELVVAGALLLVGEDGMGFGDFFELLFGVFVAWVFVGVVFEGELTVGLLDFVIGGVLGDAEYFIIITFCHGSIIPLLLENVER